MEKYIFLALAVFGAVSLVRQLWTGRVYGRRGRFIGTRESAPGDFWLSAGISIAFILIGLVTFGYLCFH